MRSISYRAIVAAMFAFTGQAIGTVPVTSSSFTYSQDFNSLPVPTSSTSADAAWTNNSTVSGWSIYAADAANVGYTPSNLALPIAVNTNRSANGSSGSDRSNTNYGTVNSSDRAIGFQAGSTHRYAAALTNITDTAPSIFGFVTVAFLNNSPAALGGFDATYTGEQWRYGAASNSADQELTFQYAIAPSATPYGGLVWSAPTIA
jgi:hypothetical protein